MSSNKIFLNPLAKTFPYLLFIVATLGLAVSYTALSSGLVLKSLVYIIPVILAGIYLLIKTKSSEFPISASSKSIIGIGFLQLLFSSIFLFITSLIVLIRFPERPWAYFIIVGLITCIIFLQILAKRPPWTDFVIIFEIVLLSLDIIWGVTLKYPLYFGASDILEHLNHINMLIQSANTASLADYTYFPLFHIYHTVGVEITGLSLRNSFFTFAGIIWEFGILISYLIFYKISDSRRDALIICLLFTVSQPMISYGMYAITRSLAFVLFLFWLYLILPNRGNFKYISFSRYTNTFISLTIYISYSFKSSRTFYCYI